jgi:hypothetical protein
MAGPKRYRAVLRTEIDFDGTFASRREFEAAVERVWNAGGYWDAGLAEGVEAEENWMELLYLEGGDDDDGE